MFLKILLLYIYFVQTFTDHVNLIKKNMLTNLLLPVYGSCRSTNLQLSVDVRADVHSAAVTIMSIRCSCDKTLTVLK